MTLNLRPNRPADLAVKVTPSRGRTRAAALTSLAFSALLGLATADGALARPSYPSAPPTTFGGDPATTIKASTSVAVSCSPSPVVYPDTALCTAVVVSQDTTPWGKVSWTTSGSGYFPSTACELATGRCTVTYRPAAGDVNANITIRATYLGTADHSASSGSTVLAVRP